ncbi:Ras guanine nucleotide exchange factor bud5 [Knufia obscura]|uniref:Ras guanine nucleotide exchange factor bud5 n=2 Tax=Knufia TaxID=430999 RepID=A0AAN8I6T0_9EURO|nr:Ras guanine nucleotide exchange factor bud5 [Knufia obscura]KAK5952266.1 Ras guanine nucleotide exchange factor bud5 [Knufia fluminis]
MQDGGYTQVHVAPLRIRKSQKDLRADFETTTIIVEDVEYGQHPEELYSPRPRFENFLRASYPFQPQDQFSSTSVTLPLSSGDIVLVHSIHTNGWADGTLLETGARGWLPTNYCEPYDYATMRPLLKALTEFWDIIRSEGEMTSELYRNHDYMRGMVAGVRFLLEKSHCLTRDAPMVKTHDSIRKTRKGLLADLSLLVKASKNIQGSEFSADSPDFERICDEILLKAFQVVTRAVNFFDVWSDQVVFTRSPRAESFSPEPLSPISSTAYGSTIQGLSKRTSVYGPQSPCSMSGPNLNQASRNRPASITRPATITHRVSYAGRNTSLYKGNLASEQLSDTYDAFLGVLASFLGSHMQSRSSSELLLTTQQAVKSCRKLLEVVEIILEHDVTRSDGLQQAKDMMYDKITELVHAAREVFRPLHSEDEDMIYLPGEGIRLVNAATNCVSGAGKCVAKARVLLEDIGDFELELRTDYSEVSSPFGTHALSPIKTEFEPNVMIQEPTSSNGRPSKPKLDIPQDAGTLAVKRGSKFLIPTSATSSFWTPVTEATGSPTSDHSESSAEIDQAEVTSQVQQQRSLARAILHGSESTLVSSARDSGPSFVSQTSTRATSPESHLKGSPRLQGDERDDDEDALMEHQFAHELVINSEGRIIGGSLNAIIERLTSHETTPDPSFVTMVYLTFRLFANPLGFAEALAYRFHYIEASHRIAQTVRLRVTNVFKGWLESHWRHDRDGSTIPFIVSFVKEQVMPVSTSAANMLLELLNVVATTHNPAVPRILSSMGKTNTATISGTDPTQPVPQPILSKSQLNALKTWKMGGSGLSVLDFDPLELARQLTIKTASIFCSILPEELLGCEFMKDSSSLAVNVRALTTFSNDLANLVVDSILLLEDAKKRAAVIKQWIKIEAKLLELHNYETLITINASLMSSTIQRLRKTWDLIGQKTKSTMEEIRRVVDHAKNYAVLRQRISNLRAPCLPYVGIYRTDLTFIDQGCQATRELKTGDETISVINLDKHSKTAKIISDLQRFQIEYKLAPVDELQTWLQDECIRVRAAGERNFQNQYRRSLLLEPKLESQQQPAPKRPNLTAFASMSSLTGKDRFDFLTWTHAKERNNSVGSS